MPATQPRPLPQVRCRRRRPPPEPRDSMPRTTEPVFNAALATALRGKYPGGECQVGAEQTAVLREKGRRPDIVVRPANSLPVIVETEFEPARGVEEDARKRLGQTFAGDGGSVEQVVAVQIPARAA